MAHEMEIEFRGKNRIVEFEHEGDHAISWWFPDDKAHEDGQGGATDDEQDAIYCTLWDYLEDWWASQNDMY